jgi:hypothetical protein
VATRPAQVSAPTPPGSEEGSESRNPVRLFNSQLHLEKDHATCIPLRFPSPALRADHPLSDDQIRSVAPSIFADDKHASRSDRYAYIPTGAVLSELRKEGFQPFMVCQTRVRDEGSQVPFLRGCSPTTGRTLPAKATVAAERPMATH